MALTPISFYLWILVLRLGMAYASNARGFFGKQHISLLPNVDPDTFAWSRDTLRLRRGEHLYLYHNYTAVTTQDLATAKFLHRETIPYFRQIVRHSAHSVRRKRLRKRGFIVNPTHRVQIENNELPSRFLSWVWKRPSPSCPVVISICFEDAPSMLLKEVMDPAIDMWAKALGPDAGVTFAYVGEGEICRDADGNWYPSVPDDVVVVRVISGDENSHYNYIGWMPGREKGRMTIKFNLDPFQGEDVYKVVMAHELGHVLGLDHEHQRFDAPQFVKIRTENIKNYEQLPAVLQEFNDRHESDFTEDELLTHYQFVQLMSEDLRQAQIPLENLVPYRKPDDPADDPFRFIDFETIGPFDYNSIMIYSSNTGGRNEADPTMVKVDGGDSWPMSRTITSGDAQAVKRLYPDNVSANYQSPDSQAPNNQVPADQS